MTQSLPSVAALRKAENEVAEYRKFQSLTDNLVGVNRKICRLRPLEQAAQTDGGKTAQIIRQEVAR